MRKVILLVMLASVSLFADIDWADDYKAAVKEAKAKHKKVIVFFSRESCAKCDEMRWTINSDKDVSDYIESRFIAVEIDTEYDKREGFKVYKTPTIYFLDSSAAAIGKPLEEALGPKGFLKKLEEVDAAAK